MRLIDAESLKEELKQRYCSDDKYTELFGVIDAQPTAYDLKKVVTEMEEYEYSHLIEHDSEQAKHCKGKEYCEYSDCLLCLWTKAKAIVSNSGKA